MSRHVGANWHLKAPVREVIADNKDNLDLCREVLQNAQKSQGAEILHEELSKASERLDSFAASNNQKNARDLFPRILRFIGEVRQLESRAKKHAAELARIKAEQEARKQELERRSRQIDELIDSHMSGWTNVRIYNNALPYIAEIKDRSMEQELDDCGVIGALEELYSKIEQHIAARRQQGHAAAAAGNGRTPFSGRTQGSGRSDSGSEAGSDEQIRAQANESDDRQVTSGASSDASDSDRQVAAETADSAPQDGLFAFNDVMANVPDEGTEEGRRMVVKAVSRSLQDAGFIVSKPVKVNEDGADVVLIQGARPAGNRAAFTVHLDGRISWKFDNYKGQTCREDMDKVLPALREIYGIELSDERVMWSNPDDQFATSRPVAPVQQSSTGSAQ